MHNYSVITLGLLASTFNVLIGLPLVILLARHERTGYDEDFLVASMRARMLPSQNACRVKADGMGSTRFIEDFRYLSICYSAREALSM